MLKLINHNRGIAIGIVLCILVLLIGFGCESKVASIKDPATKVTRAELELEVASEIARIERDTSMTMSELERRLADAAADQEEILAIAEIRAAEIERQDAVKSSLLQLGAIIAEGGTVNPVGIALTLAGILGIGAVTDNRRKDGIIAERKPPA